MKLQHKTKPVFKIDDEERKFWARNSPLDFFDVSKAKRASFPSLKPSLNMNSVSASQAHCLKK